MYADLNNADCFHHHLSRGLRRRELHLLRLDPGSSLHARLQGSTKGVR